MKYLWFIPLACSLATAQGIGGKAGIGGLSGIGGGPGGGGGTPVTFVQAPTVALNCSTTAVTCAANAFAVNNTAGNGILVCGTWGVRTGGGTGFSLASVTDSAGNSYAVNASTLAVFDTTTNYSEIGVECASTTAGILGAANTVTCNFVGTMTGFHESACFPYEVTAFAATGPSSSGNSTSATLNAGTATTTINGSFALVAGVQDDNGGGTLIITPGTGFTTGRQVGASNAAFGSEYQAQSTAGAINGTATTGGSHPFAAGLLTVHP